MFKRIGSLVILVSSILLIGCAAPVVVGFGPSQANPNSYGVVAFQPQRQVNPYVCDKGVLVTKKQTGEPVCLYRERITSTDGTVTEMSSEITPRMVGQNGNGQFGNGGGSPQGLFLYMSKTDCPQVPVGNGWARCQ